MFKFKLKHRSLVNGPVGYYDNLEFTVLKDSSPVGIAYARMESDDIHSSSWNEEWEYEFDKFIGDNYDTLHYYV